MVTSGKKNDIGESDASSKQKDDDELKNWHLTTYNEYHADLFLNITKKLIFLNKSDWSVLVNLILRFFVKKWMNFIRDQ